MRSLKQISADIDSFAFGDDAIERMSALADEFEVHPDGPQVVEAVLRLIERYPNEDFGTPGPFVHAIETFSGRGYEERLVESLQRQPTSHTLWLANRIVNADDPNGPQFLALLREIAARNDLDPAVIAEAKDFANLHG